MYNRNIYDPAWKCLRLLVILGLLGVPSTSWGQDNISQMSSAYPIQVLNENRNYFLKVDLQNKQVRPKVLLANNGNGGRQSLAMMKKQLENEGYSQWAIINGDLFSSNCPSKVNCGQGLTYINGEHRSNWSRYGNTWQARGNIGFDSSNNVQITTGGNQKKKHTTIAGGPRIVINNSSPSCQANYNWDGREKTRFELSGEEFDGNSSYWCSDTRPITMVGISTDGRYLYMGISKGGQTVTQLAQWLKDQGASEILRLDSGGSTGMYHNGIFTGGSTFRPIANAFAIVVDGSDSNSSPHKPNLDIPNDRHIAKDGRAPTLCWNRPGDPDGDKTEYRVEVKGAKSAESSWRDRDCWRPDALDGHYFNYQWRVKARDSYGAESSWSETRHFTIEQENKLPSIDFESTNGSGSSTIITRDRDWKFTGTASDPEGKLRRVEFKCNGDNCGNGDNQSTNNNWTIHRNGMLGKNEIYFRACDDKQCTDSRKVTLIIDHAKPTMTASLNGEREPNVDWYRTPVTVKLQATDQGTGGARAGIREIRYRLDNGSEQVVASGSANLTIKADGNHTVRYYAIDKAGNRGDEQSISFKLDTTPPTAPGGVSASNGAPNDQWQKIQNQLDVTWAAASDVHSGVIGYEIQLVNASGHTQQQVTRLESQRNFASAELSTGVYTLRGRTRDRAGNLSDWVTMFTLRYDNTAPENPKEATHVAEIENDKWQRVTAQPNFTWPVPHDEGSGVKGYQVYWGVDADGIVNTVQTGAGLQSTSPLCSTGATCSGYLRIRTVDQVGNQAEGWSTAFTLRYDGTPPTLDLTFPGNVTETAQSLVTLQINASDTGSGVKAMRFSHDGVTWTPWEAYASTRLWSIPAIGRQSWPVYAQVRDGVGLESAIARQEIYFEVNRAQPRSANYRLFDTSMSAGSGAHTSGSYKGQSTVGQVMDSVSVASTQYQLVGGYQAGSQAIPLIVPGHDEYLYINSVFASGIVAQTMQSATYQMIGTLGEVGLPNNETTLTSSSYQHQPGFLASTPAQSGAVVLPTPEPGPEPEPEPEPECEFPTVSINTGAIFTNDTAVSLSICAPRAVEMMISNDGGFADSPWEPYARTKAWSITTHGANVLPRWIYVAFKDDDGVTHGVYLDEIIYDPSAPTGELIVGDPWEVAEAQQFAQSMLIQAAATTANNEPLRVQVNGQLYIMQHATDTPRLLSVHSLTEADTVELFLYALDDNSGIVEMQIGATPDLVNASWEPYSAIKAWSPSSGDGKQNVYARFRDAAGNVSDAVENAFVLDTAAPTGSLRVEPATVAADDLNLTLHLNAVDSLSGVNGMRIGTSANLSTADWQPYATSLTWPLYLTDEEQEGTIYVQYRDAAGNISATYSDYYLVDRMPPVVYVEVQPGDTLTRQVDVLAYDELAYLETIRISNDPLMNDNVVTTAYTDTITWTFDERRVMWVQVADSNGNIAEPYPAYAADTDKQSPGVSRLTAEEDITTGAPSSQFAITGANFPSSQVLTVLSNDIALGTVKSDENGSFTMVITTDDVHTGQYIISISDSDTKVLLTIDPSAPVQKTNLAGTKLALPVDVVPADNRIFLPIIERSMP